MSLVKKSSFPFFDDSIFDFFGKDNGFKDPFFKRDNMPAVNIRESDSSYEIEAVIPGLKKEDIHVDIERGVLTISGESKSEQEKKDENFARKEFSYSSFKRSFSLPENITEQDVKAKYEDGILKLSVTKKEEALPPAKKQVMIE
ncbi:MAG: molecular chaperone Hsp20 [Crocinitomicaceae bacterium]|jgi:HSP20 family protein|nr:molecular chaperone Hsp20 [Crocinitomicaceae bacterium]